MDDCNKLIGSTRLEECMLDVGEDNINSLTFCRDIAHAIFMNLKAADGLSAL